MNGQIVYWNGKLVPPEEARVSVFDAGFLYGDGIYETMRAYEEHVFRLDRHLERLACSAAGAQSEGSTARAAATHKGPGWLEVEPQRTPWASKAAARAKPPTKRELGQVPYG